MPITEILKENAKKYGDDICLVELNPEVQERHLRRWKEYELVEPGYAKDYRFDMSWDEFNKMSNTIANMLMDKGIRKGDKIAILLMNCLEWLPIYFGILKTGAIVVPLNFRYTADEIRYCLELAEVDVLFFGQEFAERMESIKDDIPGVKRLIYVNEPGEEIDNRLSLAEQDTLFFGQEFAEQIETLRQENADAQLLIKIDEVTPDFAEHYFNLIAGQSADEPDVVLTDEDDAAIYFSSGTTGFPKAILHKHQSLVSACETEQNHHGQTKDDVFLCIPPLYHTGAKMHWFGSFLVGGRGVILRGVKPQWIFRAISEEKATIVWLLVPWAQDILDAIDDGTLDLSLYELPQWRLMHIGAQPVPPSLVKRWKQHFPGHDYDTNYGLSESIGPGCVHLGVENIHKVGAIGVPGYKWEAKIVDEDGRETADGKPGELLIRGRGLMSCYYNDPDATAASLRDGWLLTGDMARRDEDGFIYLVDRKKDVIISGGENIYPVQIEDFLHTHGDIKDVAVIGMPDHRLGEIPAAIIELKPGSECTEEDIAFFCKSLPRYKRPKRIIFAEVPRNPTGKIEKPKLREMYCGESLVEHQTQS